MGLHFFITLLMNEYLTLLHCVLHPLRLIVVECFRKLLIMKNIFLSYYLVVAGTMILMY